MSIEELYAQPILQLAREARDRAPVQRPTARVTVLSNRFCGDEVHLEVRVEEDNGKDSQNKHTDLRPRAVFTNL